MCWKIKTGHLACFFVYYSLFLRYASKNFTKFEGLSSWVITQNIPTLKRFIISSKDEWYVIFLSFPHSIFISTIKIYYINKCD
jgi:hypothetical protein